MINGSNIRLPNGQFSTLVTPVNKDGVTQLITPVDANGNVITGSDPSQIVSSTLPTTRVNPSTGLPSGGDPLQIGDRWYNPTTGREGFWNGTYWLSFLLYSTYYTIGTISSSTGTVYVFQPVIADAIFIETFVVTGQLNASGGTPNNSSNHWTFELRRYTDGAVTAFSPTIVTNTSTATKTATYTYRVVATANAFLQLRSSGLASSSDTSFFYPSWTQVGTPPVSAVTAFHVNYRIVL